MLRDAHVQPNRYVPILLVLSNLISINTRHMMELEEDAELPIKFSEVRTGGQNWGKSNFFNSNNFKAQLFTHYTMPSSSVSSDAECSDPEVSFSLTEGVDKQYAYPKYIRT